MTENTAFEDEVVNHFPTTFMRRRHRQAEDLNKRLRKFLLDLEKHNRNKLVGTSNLGGFHSDTKLLSEKDESIVELRQLITEAIFAYLGPLIDNECAAPPEDINLTLWGWCVIMREGNYNHQHMHPDANLSGVYYVTTPKVMQNSTTEQPHGCISFVDPRPRADAMRLPNQFSAHAINPEAGDMVIFPSYYEHSVTPFRGAGVRICIAFNAKLK
jgi:uncharacterized protein (TIGR02466 family)